MKETQNKSKQTKNRRIRTWKRDARTNQNNISPSLSFLLSAEVKRWTSFFSSVSLLFSLFPLFSSQLSFFLIFIFLVVWDAKLWANTKFLSVLKS